MAKKKKIECAIIMPISGIDELGPDHCSDVLEILSEAIDQAGFEPKPAWINTKADIIQRKIIENLFKAEIAICDVSGQNPNVMFELGMRLAFDKPTIIVKDDATDFCFDISGLHHETYPRDLRLGPTRQFISDISTQLRARHNEYATEDYTSFLKSLGPFVAETPDTKDIDPALLSYEKLEILMSDISDIKYQLSRKSNSSGKTSNEYIQIFPPLKFKNPKKLDEAVGQIGSMDEVDSFEESYSKGGTEITVKYSSNFNIGRINSAKETVANLIVEALL